MTELDSLNKFITEKVFGDCWHIYRETDPTGYLQCNYCGDVVRMGWEQRTDFTTPEGWWKLWNEAKGREDWRQFVMETIADNGNVQYDYDTLDLFIDLQAFPKAYAKWRGWKGE